MHIILGDLENLPPARKKTPLFFTKWPPRADYLKDLLRIADVIEIHHRHRRHFQTVISHFPTRHGNPSDDNVVCGSSLAKPFLVWEGPAPSPALPRCQPPHMHMSNCARRSTCMRSQSGSAVHLSIILLQVWQNGKTWSPRGMWKEPRQQTKHGSSRLPLLGCARRSADGDRCATLL